MSALPKTEPVVLRWYPGSGGVLIDADLNCHTGKALLGWLKRGIDFVVLDDETGRDITRVFLAQWNESLTEVIDPVGTRHARSKAGR
jgi:hypothetical protein